ncbi:PadR family transcriptional regulator [Phytohabitans sp. ZYX-F-186]|uniref:PadR family transcriptional regulator n=1 Tax=Phytohabitans maris TaxID=3071409 RepID=A0ABU0ZMN4_9ACTN|nr:PadR family transcriptional regulator [Phytohabitans sp. ZYX-F-186]MDQ7907192.1 PadR family transcriptional regulator [Phytohabitans sp. ZYX-F-186]
MTAVFSHGRLRLYLLKLLDEGPKHGYELIRLLENRFLGLYAPSAGTIYPRLQRMEAEGLVSHTAAGGRKVYEITDAGRAELRQRAGELEALESDIRASVEDLATLANEIQDEVRGSVRDLKRELSQAARETRRGGGRDYHWEFQWAGPGSPTRGEPASGSALDELEKRIDAFAAEVRQLVRGARLTEGQARTATRVLDASLVTLRRLFRG